MASEIIGLSSSYKFIWKIENFSEINSHEGLCSAVFSVGSSKWKVSVYPKGKGKVYDHLSVFVRPVDLTQPMNMGFSFAVTSQTDRNINTVRQELKHKFSGEAYAGWGWPNFMPLSELHDTANGYLVDDACVIKVEVTYRLKEDSDDDDDSGDD